MVWLYNSKELTDEDIPEEAIGFIYKITNNVSGRKYIGKKLLTMAGTKQVKGKKKKIRKQSNWKDYWSSCDELKEDVLEIGKDKFTREIICFTHTISIHTYLENKYLYINEVLESDDWYNSNISSKIFKNRILGHV